MPLLDHGSYVIDSETTGKDATVDKVVEISVRSMDGSFHFESLVNPQMPIPADACAIHHITDEMVKDAPLLDEVMEDLCARLPDDAIFFAHNASFDRAFFPQLQDKRWLCSLRLARHMWPDAPRHTNQSLRYWLPGVNDAIEAEQAHLRAAAQGELRDDFARCINEWVAQNASGDSTALTNYLFAHANPAQMFAAMYGQVPHRAGFDTLVTKHIVHQGVHQYEMMNPDATLEQFEDYINSPILLKSLHFGKHAGQDLSDPNAVPFDYLKWARSAAANKANPGPLSDDPDVVFTVKHYFEQRLEMMRELRVSRPAI